MKKIAKLKGISNITNFHEFFMNLEFLNHELFVKKKFVKLKEILNVNKFSRFFQETGSFEFSVKKNRQIERNLNVNKLSRFFCKKKFVKKK